MLNMLKLGQAPVNSTQKLSGPVGTIENTSFSLTLNTKYGFKTSDGMYFQFNSIELGNKYGNIMEEHNFDSIPDIDVTKYANALKNGGKIYDRRYKEKLFEVSFTINSDTLKNLEDEIRNIKTYFEIGGDLYKIEKNVSLKTSVKLTNLEVSRLRLSGTTIKVQLLTMDPFWTTTSAITTFEEDNVGSFAGSITLSHTKIKGYVRHMIFLRTVTGTINQLTLTLDGFPIVINQTFVSGDVVVLDGINNDGLVNGNKVKYLGQFPELDIGNSHPLSVTFSGGGSVDSFDLYNIYENKQL